MSGGYMYVNPANAKPFFLRHLFTELTPCSVSCIWSQGEISNAAHPARATSLAAFSNRIRDLKCTITSHRVERDGSVELEVLASGKNTVNQLIDSLLSRGIEVKVLGLTSAIGSRSVTARQEEVVRKALEMGYYDYPRRIRQKDLAKACGVSSSTLAELLRRAEHNIVKVHTGRQGMS